jgi:lipopolysaccharide/colanic/teichoic acid biosynthesis glycosyltransferase
LPDISNAGLAGAVYGNGNGNGNGKGNGNGNGKGHYPLTAAPLVGAGHGNDRGNLAAALQVSAALGAFVAGGNGNGNGNGNGAHRAEALTAAFLMRAPAPLGLTTAAGALASSAESWVQPAAPPRETYYLRYGKRVFDIVAAGVGLLLVSPVLLLFAALIKLDSRGPVLYRSMRLGKNGKPFTFYKLRSMYAGADRDREQLQHLNEVDGPVFKISSDPRTTRVGRLIRQTSIDEFPQFLNVLRGDMSMVGPRPPLPAEAEQYEAWQRRRLEVKPGITCLWQISGRSRLGFNEWMRLDLEYIKRQSLATDLRILWRTIPAVISREGAY